MTRKSLVGGLHPVLQAGYGRPSSDRWHHPRRQQVQP